MGAFKCPVVSSSLPPRVNYPAPQNGLSRFFALSSFDPERCVTTWAGPPWLLLIVRLVIMAYSLTAIITSWILERQRPYRFWVFFTNLTYTGLVLYFLAASIHSLIYVLRPKPRVPSSFLRQPRPFSYAFWFLYETLITFHVIVPTTFWILLAKDVYKLNRIEYWRNLSVHGMDLVVMVIEGFLSRNNMALSHFVACILLLLLYLCLAILNRYINNFWVYEFLNWERNGAGVTIGSYVGLIVFALVVYILWFLVHLVKNRYGDPLWERKWKEPLPAEAEAQVNMEDLNKLDLPTQ
ncbi:uncharacterized protein VTP21DRAFT_397 [Calcarisporiella thermophila]|uniref:uncharacterized protein n=1 Tax=Calcarisporiella thermophila TaxID=911321 RepID=UPI0037445615